MVWVKRGSVRQPEPGRGLHPRVGDDDPEGRERRAQRHHQRGEPAHERRDALAAEDQQPEEARLEEEGEDALGRQRSAEDVADEARVGRPVGAELELHDDAGRDPDHKGHGEQAEPEVGGAAIDVPAGAPARGLQQGNEQRQPDGDGREQEVEHDGQRELQPRQPDYVHGTSMRTMAPPSARPFAIVLTLAQGWGADEGERWRASPCRQPLAVARTTTTASGIRATAKRGGVPQLR
jgi:hypothetical protein